MKFSALFAGLTTVDIQYFVDVFPTANKKVKSEAPDILVGGPATNAAIAFSALNKGAFLVSSVGESSFSDFIKSDFAHHNLQFTDLSFQKANQPVIASVVTSANGNRNIFTHHPRTLVTDCTPEQILNEINPEIVLLDGFYPEFSIDVAREAQKRNIPVVIDCGSWKPHFSELLSFIDIAICSADFYPPSCRAAESVFDFLQEFGISKIAISRGANSILYLDGKDTGEIAVENAIVVDTLGAGDILHGAFCYYYLLGHRFDFSLERASKIASFSCYFKGTREWLTYLDVYLTKNS